METSSCGKKFLFLKRTVGSRHYFAFVPSRCKSWSCPICKHHKAHTVKKFIESSFTDQTLWMLSITFFHSGNPLDAWRMIGENCNKMLTYAHKYSGSFEYVRIVEPHKDGMWPHVHVIVNKPIASTEFVRLLTQWGFGWNFHSKPISAKLASVYLSKYLSKPWPTGDAELYRVMSKTRIVSCSRSLGSIFTKESDWESVSYDEPAENAKAYCNIIITYLSSKKASYIHSIPYCGGFCIESDREVLLEDIKGFPDPYIWDYSGDFQYDYFTFAFPYSLFDN